MPDPPAFTKSQERFFSLVNNTSRNIFLTGSAGTGKTFALKQVKQTLTDQGKVFVVVAPTGAAAYNCEGRTVHSAFKPLPRAAASARWSPIPTCMADTRYGILTDVDTNPTVKIGDLPTPWSEVDVLFIEEVSMLDAGLFAVLDACLRRARGSNCPFGGLRTVCVGDFGQLRPVAPKTGEDSPNTGLYAFEPFTLTAVKEGYQGSVISTWANANFVYCPLVENVRQQGDGVSRLVCEYLRSGEIYSQFPWQVKKALLRCAEYGTPDELIRNRPKFEDAPRIYWSNAAIDSYNQARNSLLTDELLDLEPTFTASTLGGPAPTMQEIASALADKRKTMKEAGVGLDKVTLYAGSRLMITRNNESVKGHYNGAVGTATHVETKRFANKDTKTLVYVSTPDGPIPVAAFEDEEQYEFQRPSGPPATVTVKCSFFPLTLAYAISFHKCQGATLTGPVIIMVNSGMGSFAGGANMAYVGVSRATSIDNVALLCDKHRDSNAFLSGEPLLARIFLTDPKVLDFYDSLNAKHGSTDWGATPFDGGRVCLCCGETADVLFRPCMHAAACQRCTAKARATAPAKRLTCVACGATVHETLVVARTKV